MTYTHHEGPDLYSYTVPTVRNSEFTTYLEAFHQVYRETVEDKLPPQLLPHVVRYQRLPTGIVGYISTQFGAGYEYIAGSGISIVSGSSRVEDLLFRAPSNVRRGGTMIKMLGKNTSISGLTLDGAFPVRLAAEDASITLTDMRAKAGSWSREVEYAELFGTRSREFWTVDWAARRAVEEVLEAAVDAYEMHRRQLDLADFLNRFRQRKVLVLGDFKAGRDRLVDIAARLEALGYLPLFADEVEAFPEYDLRQKVLMLALLCRFVVVDDSTAAGQIAELVLAEIARKVTIVLRRSGQRSSWMTAGVSTSSKVMTEREYNEGELDTALSETVAWAEQEIERLGQTFDEALPWRKPV